MFGIGHSYLLLIVLYLSDRFARTAHRIASLPTWATHLEAKQRSQKAPPDELTSGA
jgi:hypothetical protein